MKQGSKLRKCYECGEKLFWIIPTGEDFFGIPEATIKTIKPHKAYRGKYYCEKCYNERTVTHESK